MPEVIVDIDWHGRTFSVGNLWFHIGRGKQASSFAYTMDWLQEGYELDPELPLGRGVFHSATPLFSCFTDSAPDRWGKVLLKRREMQTARSEKRTPRTLLEMDFLLGINDFSRQGAFRFRDGESGEYLSTNVADSIPPVVQLGQLLHSAMAIGTDRETMGDLELLLVPGSSLGGARPKASVMGTNGELLIAKFPRPGEEWDVPLWEYVGFQLACAAGIRVPTVRLQRIGATNVLISQRFDRSARGRIPFASAMTLLGCHDGDSRSYLDIAEILLATGSEPEKDMKELWKRMVFNILVGNVDDHLRNHGFLRALTGWGLSPVYDIEPTPETHKPRILHTTISEKDGTGDPELALSVAEYFGLSLTQAREEMVGLAHVVSRWRSMARELGAAQRDIEIMRYAFLENITPQKHRIHTV